MYRLSPIDTDTADRLRAAFPDAPHYVADTHPGYPCRQCLRDAQVGEELILVSHDPFPAASASPYRSASPIFLHRRPCGVADDLSTIGPQQTGRQLSARAYDADDMMLDADVLAGTELELLIEKWFGDPAIDHVHVHNAGRGCWAVRIDRSP